MTAYGHAFLPVGCLKVAASRPQLGCHLEARSLRQITSQISPAIC
jgi:hypothetical protein